eukprot:TRINITY_DN14827_c0_g1_i1.p2 TRINITY_DN14827_c0_g1~~TRINITY_DN14827_c0_g1_i1.p2  ORF type:complete len:238 (+),score=50.23 TRINITY_DN14827_c0_g1_i1:1307-2020(+)
MVSINIHDWHSELNIYFFHNKHNIHNDFFDKHNSFYIIVNIHINNVDIIRVFFDQHSKLNSLIIIKFFGHSELNIVIVSNDHNLDSVVFYKHHYFYAIYSFQHLHIYMVQDVDFNTYDHSNFSDHDIKYNDLSDRDFESDFDINTDVHSDVSDSDINYIVLPDRDIKYSDFSDWDIESNFNMDGHSHFSDSNIKSNYTTKIDAMRSRPVPGKQWQRVFHLHRRALCWSRSRPLLALR